MCVYSRLDYDFLPDHKYEFSVIATDGGSPPLTATAVVQVDFCFDFCHMMLCSICCDPVSSACLCVTGTIISLKRQKLELSNFVCYISC